MMISGRVRMLVRDRSMVELSIILERFVASFSGEPDQKADGELEELLRLDDMVLYDALKGSPLPLVSEVARSFERFVAGLRGA